MHERNVAPRAATGFWLLVLAAPGLWAQAPASAPATPGVVDPLLLQVPRTGDEIAARERLARERLEWLAPTTQPTTMPTDEVGTALLEARTTLFGDWQAYLEQLQRLSGLLEQQRTLAGESRIAELTDHVAELERKTAELTAAAPPLGATAEDIDQITARYRERDTQLLALSDLQTRRAAQLATGFRQQREGFQAELQRQRQARSELQATVDAATTTTPADVERYDLRRRRLDVQLAALELRLHALAVEEEQTKLLQRQDERHVAALRDYVVALRQRMTAMTEARGRSALEVIELKRQRATEPHRRAFLDLQYFYESVLIHYFRNQAFLNDLKDRFPASALDRFRARVTDSTAAWQDTLETLEYRVGRMVLRLYHDVRRERRLYEAELAARQRQLGQTVSDIHELKVARERALQRFQELSRKVDAAAAAADPAERTRLETEMTQLQSRLVESIAATLADADELESRLRDAIELAREHVSTLHAAQDGLHRTALVRRESGLAGLEWSAVGGELRQLVGVAPPDPAVTAAGRPSLAAAGLIDVAPEVRERLAQQLSKMAADFQQAGWRALGLLVISLAAAGGIGGWVRRAARDRVQHARQRLAALAAEVPAGEEAPRHFSDRTNLAAWRLVQDLAIPVAAALALWAVAWVVGLPARTFVPWAAIAGVWLAAFAVLRVLRWLFHADERCRIVACDDRTARYQRSWCRALVLVTAVLLPVHLFLVTTSVGPALQILVWEVFKTLVLVTLLALLARKDRVVGLLGAPRGNWRHTVATALHPLLFVAVLGLLVLQVIGYGVLVAYIGGAVLLSGLVLVVIGGIVEYLCDVLDVYAPGGAACAPAKDPRPSASPGNVAHPEVVTEASSYLARFLKTLLRLAGFGLAAFVILRIWGDTTVTAALDWKLIGLVAALVVAALVVDRLVVTALQALYVSGRLPESISNLIRRWVRGLLTVIVVLAAITLAGYSIDRLWTSLLALIGLIAIGFVAVWSMLSNILATFMILIWRPFNVGDRVEIQPDGIKGRVVDISFMFTMLRADSGAQISVPNSMFLQKFVHRERAAAAPRRTLAEQLVAEKPLGE